MPGRIEIYDLRRRPIEEQVIEASRVADVLRSAVACCYCQLVACKWVGVDWLPQKLVYLLQQEILRARLEAPEVCIATTRYRVGDVVLGEDVEDLERYFVLLQPWH